MISADILPDTKLPYQGGALPLSYGSDHRLIDEEGRANQAAFELYEVSVQLPRRAQPRRTAHEQAGLCVTMTAQSRSHEVPTL